MLAAAGGGAAGAREQPQDLLGPPVAGAREEDGATGDRAPGFEHAEADGHDDERLHVGFGAPADLALEEAGLGGDAAGAQADDAGPEGWVAHALHPPPRQGADRVEDGRLAPVALLHVAHEDVGVGLAAADARDGGGLGTDDELEVGLKAQGAHAALDAFAAVLGPRGGEDDGVGQRAGGRRGRGADGQEGVLAGGHGGRVEGDLEAPARGLDDLERHGRGAGVDEADAARDGLADRDQAEVLRVGAGHAQGDKFAHVGGFCGVRRLGKFRRAGRERGDGQGRGGQEGREPGEAAAVGACRVHWGSPGSPGVTADSRSSTNRRTSSTVAHWPAMPLNILVRGGRRRKRLS
jgi:hypothetical protein